MKQWCENVKKVFEKWFDSGTSCGASLSTPTADWHSFVASCH